MANPIHTPWGVPQGAPEVLAPGIVSYETASHGGIWLDPEHNAKVPQAWRDASFGGLAAGGWYEEDCDWCIPALVFPAAFSADMVAQALQTFKACLAPKVGPLCDYYIVMVDGVATDIRGAADMALRQGKIRKDDTPHAQVEIHYGPAVLSYPTGRTDSQTLIAIGVTAALAIVGGRV